jgi:hypothetical protein
LSKLDRGDIVVDLGNKWHFNTTVYDHQVRGAVLEDTHLTDLQKKTYRYNKVLSDSKFSLCPAGAGPNTLRLWESIAVGSIPVLFDEELLLPAVFADELKELCVYWTDACLGEKLVNHLRSFSTEELQLRSDGLREIYSAAKEMTCF